MARDISRILGEWLHEPGELKVRKITGEDGKEKIQMRVDLGLLQMEMTGRPDGQRPHGCESLLDHFRAEQRKAEAGSEPLQLNEEDCFLLQQEGMQYYHRYIALFQLQEYELVVRDTERNLQLFDFLEAHAEPGSEAGAMGSQVRPFILMVNTRARVARELQLDRTGAAIEQIARGVQRIRHAYRTSGREDELPDSPEIRMLGELKEELRKQLSSTAGEKLELALLEAIEKEEYEEAARLRDQIQALESQS